MFIGVFVGPGLTATTRTPVPRVSAHSAWVNERTYALVAAYTARWGAGAYAPVLAMLTTAPRPRATIPGGRRAVSSVNAVTLTSIRVRNRAGSPSSSALAR